MDVRFVLSLYRTYIRQVRRLPLPYLRYFFRIKAFDDIRAILWSPNDRLRLSKVKRVSRDVNRIEAANNRNTKAFEHVLDLAYGRKGKLKWEIMEPILSNPKAQAPPRIISTVEKSRPPIYSPELKALLTAGLSRKTKPLKTKSLSFPPTLPARADPMSDDAHFLGPLSKRLEVNIRWKYFNTEWKKVRPPLEVTVNDLAPSKKVVTKLPKPLTAAVVRQLGMQGYGIFEDAEKVAGPLTLHQPLTRKEKGVYNNDVIEFPLVSERHPSRWVRRRYQALLGRIPMLTCRTDECGRTTGSFSVSLSPNATTPSSRFDANRVPQLVATEDQAWIKVAIEHDGGTEVSK